MAEHRGEMYAKFYIPRDERVTLVHTPGLVQKDAIEEASRKMMPALYALYSTQVEFQSLDQVFDLFKKGGSMSSADSKCAPKCAPSEAEAVIKLRPPKVIAGIISEVMQHDRCCLSSSMVSVPHVGHRVDHILEPHEAHRN